MSRFCNFVYAWCVQHMSNEDRVQWDAMLNEPLPGRENAEPTEEQLEQESEGFMGLMTMAGGGMPGASTR